MTGWLSDFFIRRGHSPTLVRKSAMVIGHTIAAIAVAGCALSNPQWYPVCLVATGVGCGAVGAGPLAFSQTLAGPHGAGKWTGLQNGFANVAGVVAPALTGFLVERTGELPGPTRDHCCGIGGWRSLVGVCGRPGRTSELEIRAAHSTRSGL
jgi:MFS transporter, ACS family, D-galactonate transporter